MCNNYQRELCHFDFNILSVIIYFFIEIGLVPSIFDSKSFMYVL